MNILSQAKRMRARITDHVYTKLVEKDRKRAKRKLHLLDRKQNGADKQIKVGFITQEPSMWNKQAPLYERMVEDPRFDPWLIVVPAYSNITHRRTQYGAELDFFQNAYPTGNILTANELTSEFRGLGRLHFDYFFLQRCWESTLPKSFRTRSILKYAKTCYVPYAFHCFQPYPAYYQTRFFASLSVMFCCSQAQQKSCYPSTPARKAVSLGFPCLDGIRSYGTCKVSEPHGRTRLLWTPRWQDNPRYGGTTFFTYKDRFFDLARQHPELDIVFRPHPLTFDNAIKTGKMTPEEVTAYKARCEEAGIRFDSNASIDDTLPEVDIMISDFSSILVDAALMGKTILYCGGNALGEYSETMAQIMDCAYHAGSWEELTDLLEQLLQGSDPKFEPREQLANRLAAEHEGSTARILQYLFDDANASHAP
jgi:hypothetical protein